MITAEQRRVLTAIATTGRTPVETSERTYMSLARRLLVGTADRLPNGEGGVSAITTAGCDAVGITTTDALRVGEPFPYWVERR